MDLSSPLGTAQPWFYDPVKLYTFFGALVTAVVVASILTFVGVRYLTRHIAIVIARRTPHLIHGWAPTWVAPMVDLQTAWKAYGKGDTQRALDAVDRMVAWALQHTHGTSCPWRLLNSAVCVMIAGGRYREALGLAARWPATARMRGREQDPSAYVLTQLNLVEALYNLGRLGCANDALERVRVESENICDPMLASGVTTQRAWLAVLKNRPTEALELAASVVPSTLPTVFRSEVCYTRAAALRDLGQADAAKREAERGLEAAIRASSRRNGVFLLGTIAFSVGDYEAAVAYFEAGAAQPYRGQGGNALLMLGEAYERLHRSADMRRAQRMVLERDSQSAAARIAKRRLAACRRSQACRPPRDSE